MSTTPKKDATPKVKVGEVDPAAPVFNPDDQPGVLVTGPGETPDGALDRESWAAAALLTFGVAPEVARYAMQPDRYYTRDEAEQAIQEFLVRPVQVDPETTA